MPEDSSAHPIRWQVAARLIALAAAVITWVRWQDDWPFQKRNLVTLLIVIVTVGALLVWWLFMSRASWSLRLRVLLPVLAIAATLAAMLRVEGVSGDLLPVLVWRWQHAPASPAPTATPSTAATARLADFPQFYGPDRTGVLPGPKLVADWTQHPPKEVWRRPIGAGWSGFSVAGELCITQEQRRGEECISSFDVRTGQPRWSHSYPARYQTTIGGEGPRATPTIFKDHVFTHGSTGIVHCLDLATGKVLWMQDVVKAVRGTVPEWGAASSPLLVNDLVIVHGGEHGTHSLLALRITDGEIAWKGGRDPGYATPVLATLAGAPQILAFHHRSIAGHDPATGATLWELPWGTGNVVCASPVIAGPDQVLFSSGYGVGAELIEITRSGTGFGAKALWHSTRMKAKFSHLFLRDGCVFGLDDGIFACADLKDGSKHWRDGRYGHGQGLVIGDHYLLMSEPGELILLHPTKDAPNELARFSVLHSKTWNPIALAGELLLVRNDREAVCLSLALE